MTAPNKRANWRTPDATLADVDEHADRQAWLNERRNGIGGTDAVTLMGTHVGKVKPKALWDEKRSKREPRELNLPAFRFGHALEPRLRAEAAAEHDVRVRPGGFYRNKKHPWRYANPDGLTSCGGLLEIKTTSTKSKSYPAWAAGEVPAHAYDQGQHYLSVTGRTHVHYVMGVYPDGWQDMDEADWPDAVTEVIHIGPIPRDEARIAEMLEAQIDFWGCLETGVLSERWGPREVEALIPEMLVDDLGRLAAVKASQESLAGERAAIERRLKAALSDRAGLLTLGGIPRVELTEYEAETFDKKKFGAAHPELLAQFTGKAKRKRLNILDERAQK